MITLVNAKKSNAKVSFPYIGIVTTDSNGQVSVVNDLAPLIVYGFKGLGFSYLDQMQSVPYVNYESLTIKSKLGLAFANKSVNQLKSIAIKVAASYSDKTAVNAMTTTDQLLTFLANNVK